MQVNPTNEEAARCENECDQMTTRHRSRAVGSRLIC
jgi:hypothetical protein